MLNKKAFTLVEILMVMVVIGIMATIIFPRLFRRKPSEKWSMVLDRFNNSLVFARQEAISSGKNYRILFKSNSNNAPDFIVVQQEERDKEDKNKKIFKDVTSEYFETKYELPTNIKMLSFYKNKVEQFAESSPSPRLRTTGKNNAFCYIIPNGLIQDVMIYLVKRVKGKEDKVTFKSEPFLGEFKMTQGFTKP